MKQTSFYYHDNDPTVCEQFSVFLQEAQRLMPCASMMIQVFSSLNDHKKLRDILQKTYSALPFATIIGASTAGEIEQQHLHDDGVLFSITSFDNVNLSLAFSTQTDAYDAGQQIATQIITPNTRCIIAFADGISMNGEAFIRGIDHISHNIPIAGGMSGDGTRFAQCFVIAQDNIIPNAAVAVSLNSDTLQLWQDYNLSWRPIGRSMTITKADGNRIYEIDHQPAVEIYREYLGEEIVADLPTTASEFPLIFEQQGVDVARSMLAAANADGSLPYAGDTPQGSKVRFGVASAQLLAKGRESLFNKLNHDAPDVIFTYSCIARRLFLGQTIDTEFAPLTEVAPVVGFFTYGEFYATNSARQFLNITTTVLALREPSDTPKKIQHAIEAPSIKSSLTTQALLNLTDKVMQDLQDREKENDRLNNAINQVLIISRTNPKGIITYANELFCDISGYTMSEILGQPHNIVRHPDMSPDVFKTMWRTISKGEIWHGIIKNKTKDGAAYTVKSFVLPITNEQGKIVEYLAIREDISDLIQTQDSLREQQLFTKTVMDLAESIVLIMKNNKPFSFNSYFFELFNYAGIADFEQQHRCICELFIAKDGFLTPTTEQSLWFEPIFKYPDEIHKALLKDKFGHERIFSVKIRIMPFKEQYMIVTFTEITVIENAKEAALAAKAQQEQFLAAMSHEIRTPLNGVLGFLGLLGDTSLDETQQHYLDVIQNSSQTLLSIINDILDVSKINQGAMTLDLHPVDMKHELPLFASLYHASAVQKSIDYTVTLDERIHRCLHLDWLRMKQIIGNLVGNAIKFTPNNGRIDLSITCEQDSESQQTIKVSVKDTGIGIAADKQQHVFDAFSQADNSTARQYGGTGLGLSISAKLAILMHTKLELISKLGKGSEFFMLLTADKCQEKTSEAPSLITSEMDEALSSIPLRTLVAEDNPTNRMLIKALLAKQNIVPDFAENGREAVEMVMRQVYDIVFMDIHMPFLDGSEATQQIRAANIDVPIIALTANALDGERERLLALGMNDYLSKPIDVKQLHAVITHYRQQL
jgi:PAS domain S-box-containing protein